MVVIIDFQFPDLLRDGVYDFGASYLCHSYPMSPCLFIGLWHVLSLGPEYLDLGLEGRFFSIIVVVVNCSSLRARSILRSLRMVKAMEFSEGSREFHSLIRRLQP